jgi:hypothetical protein
VCDKVSKERKKDFVRPAVIILVEHPLVEKLLPSRWLEENCEANALHV